MSRSSRQVFSCDSNSLRIPGCSRRNVGLQEPIFGDSGSPPIAREFSDVWVRRRGVATESGR